MSASAVGGVQAVARAAAILGAVGTAPGQLRLVDVVRQLHLAKTTAHRIVGTLEAEQFLEVDAAGRLWLGQRFVELASHGQDQLAAQLHPLLVDVARQVEETVDLSTLVGRSAMFVDQIPSSHRLRAVSAVGERFPLHASANGKAMLAALSNVEVERLCSRELDRYTSHTIVDRARLIDELEEVRARGYALDRGEHTEGIHAVGVAALGPTGRPVAISVPAPADRFATSEPHLVAVCLDVRPALASALARP